MPLAAGIARRRRLALDLARQQRRFDREVAKYPADQKQSAGLCAARTLSADTPDMNRISKGVTLVPLTGLIPFRLALLASFIRFAPIAVRAGEGARRAVGANRSP